MLLAACTSAAAQYGNSTLPCDDSSSLPFTGSTLAVLVIAALVLIGVGLWLWSYTRETDRG